jgi:hypothetical protein
VHRLVEANDVGLRAILKEHAKLDAGAIARLDQGVGAPGRHVDRLLGQHVEAALGGTNPLLGVQPRRAADGDKVHRLVREERIELRVRLGMKRRRQPLDALRIRAVHRDNLDVADRGCRARVRLADVPRAENADPDRHGGILIRDSGGSRC